MRRARISSLAAIILFCLGCGTYQEGYDDGFAGWDKISFAAEEYKNGYNEGQLGAYFYQQGQSDGAAGRAPQPALEHQVMYREGYRQAGGLLH